MRIITTVKHTPKETVVEVAPEHSLNDSATTTNIGNSILETTCDFMRFTRKKIGKGLRIVLPHRGAVRDWLCNSQNRPSSEEAEDALRFVLDRLPHIRTKKDKQEIEDRVKKALSRLSW